VNRKFFVVANACALIAAIAILQGISTQNLSEKFSAPDKRATEVILQEAAATARQERKYVFVVVGTSWCQGCSELMKALESEPLKDIVARNYVVIKLQGFESPGNVHLENKGIRELHAKWAEGAVTGFPYYVVLDGKLRPIMDCLDGRWSRKVNMVGFVGAQGDHFISVLKRTAKNLKPGEIDRLVQWIENK